MTRAESALRAVFADPAYDLAMPPDPVPRIVARAAARRRRVWARALGALGVVTLVAGIGAVALRKDEAPAPTTVPVAPGLLDWATRGDLARDTGFRAAALDVWRARTPVRSAHALYLGRVGLGRVAVLEGLVAGAPVVAVVGEHGRSTMPTLSLDASGALPNPGVAFLGVAYDGQVHLPGLTPAPPAAYLQVLAAPDVSRVERRTARGYVSLAVRGGLSAPWLHLGEGNSRGVVRAFVRDDLSFEGLLPADSPVPVRVAVTRAEPPWPPVGSPGDDSQLHDDALLFAALEGWPALEAALLWAGVLPDGTPARIVYAAAPGTPAASVGIVVGRFARTALHGRVVRPPGLRGVALLASYLLRPGGDSYVLALGGPSVAQLRYPAGLPGQRVARGRLLVAVANGDPVVTAYDARGRVLARASATGVG